MPTRPRSHQLEDISIQRFEQLLPDPWVCRRKDKNYGVDLEVEIFDDFGGSTGLTFLVQLKATDSNERQKSVSIKVERLLYLASLDSPSIVVRYGHTSGQFYWKWISSIFSEIGHPTTETVTLNFHDREQWREASPKEIVATLHVFRTIRIASRRTPIGIEVKTEGISAQDAFELNHAVAQIRDSSNLIRSDSDPRRCLPITIWLEDGALCTSINVVASLKVVLRNFERREILSQLVYLLAYMTGRADFIAQSIELASIARDRSLRCQSRFIASSVACYILQKTDLAADIISINEIHALQDKSYALYLSHLLDHDVPLAEKKAAAERFYKEAVEAHADQSDLHQSTVHYSFGNFLRVSLDLRGALTQFNLACKKNPEYLEKPYLLAEVGAVLYFSRRYRLAAQFYSKAYSIENLPRVALTAGDAHLLSGSFSEAKRYFTIANNSPDDFEAAEGALKTQLSMWVEAFVGHNPSSRERPLSSVDLWIDVMEQCLEDENYDHALNASLMVCFLLENSVGAWTDAIQIATKSRFSEHFLATVSCAMWRCGYDAYSEYRDILTRNDFSSDMLQPFDDLAQHLYTKRTSTEPANLTLRFVDQHHFDTMLEVDDDCAPRD